MAKYANSKLKPDHTRYDKDGNYIPHGEVNSGEVMTVQSEAYSIKELYDKFVTGVYSINSFMNRNMTEVDYEEDMMDSELPEFIDIIDAQEYIRGVNEKVEKAKGILKAAKDKVKEMKKDDEPVNKDVKSTDNDLAKGSTT